MDATMNFDMTNRERTEAATAAARNAADTAIEHAISNDWQKGRMNEARVDAFNAAYAEAYAGYANDLKDLWSDVQADANEVAYNTVNPW